MGNNDERPTRKGISVAKKDAAGSQTLQSEINGILWKACDTFTAWNRTAYADVHEMIFEFTKCNTIMDELLEWLTMAS
jgi:hypothetical protein